MGNIRFLFFDLDGTLLDDRKRIDPELVEYLRDLKKRKDVRYGISTGRHAASVEPYLAQYDLKSLFDGMICNSGADIYFYSPWEHVKNNYLSVNTLCRLLKLFKAYGNFISCGFHSGDQLVTTGENHAVDMLIKRNHYNTSCRPENVALLPAPKFLLLFDPEDRDRVAAAVEEKTVGGLRAVFTEPDICEYVDDRNSKAAGVKLFLERFGVAMGEIMAFGDAENDRQIMCSAGVSVCMKNGGESIRALADYVTEKTNNENGIMDFLQKHEALLREKREGESMLTKIK